MFSNHFITPKRYLSFVSILLTAIPLGAQAPLDKVAVVHSFTRGTASYNPTGPLIQLPNGNFAGMTFADGANRGQPSVFTMTPDGTVTTLYTFAADSSEGANPGGIMQASDGNFYGICASGGPYDLGTLFRVTRTGVFTKFYNFPPANGVFGGTRTLLVEAPDGYLYGVTGGGANGAGAIFRFSLKTQKTTLFYSFFPNFVGPAEPAGDISLGPDGRLYGSTVEYYSPDGSYSHGAAYAIDTAGNLSTLAVYDDLVNGAFDAPVFLNDGYAYFAGLTGGTGTSCLNGCGSIFRVAVDGSGAELSYSFAGGTDGESPLTVAAGSDGLFYGYNVTSVPTGGVSPTLFQVNTATQTGETWFFPPASGTVSQLPLTQSASGVFHGANQQGGPSDGGSVFVFNSGAPPPLPLIYGFFPASGPPGTVVTIWGLNYTGVKEVTLNGAAVQGAAKSAQFLRFVVPPFASSGPITITTAAGSATSSTSFLVQ